MAYVKNGILPSLHPDYMDFVSFVSKIIWMYHLLLCHWYRLFLHVSVNVRISKILHKMLVITVLLISTKKKKKKCTCTNVLSFHVNLATVQILQNFENDFFEPLALVTFKTLKRTVLLSGRHSPTVTMSPICTSLETRITMYIDLNYIG